MTSQDKVQDISVSYPSPALLLLQQYEIISPPKLPLLDMRGCGDEPEVAKLERERSFTGLSIYDVKGSVPALL